MPQCFCFASFLFLFSYCQICFHRLTWLPLVKLQHLPVHHLDQCPNTCLNQNVFTYQEKASKKAARLNQLCKYQSLGAVTKNALLLSPSMAVRILGEKGLSCGASDCGRLVSKIFSWLTLLSQLQKRRKASCSQGGQVRKGNLVISVTRKASKSNSVNRNASEDEAHAIEYDTHLFQEEV